jgi:hypothetical protein
MAATLLDSWLGRRGLRGSIVNADRLTGATLLRLRWRVSRQAARLVLGSLVNGFTNYRNVKGEVGQKSIRVMDVTHVSSGLPRYLHTSHYNSA